ncbi:uncharacterized protein LOC143037447 [Oratosquilla oratoria]|uniref:uncharacterized protein LOC143037447 n=1 Tax=Oratosquilla oratoria TaxID=337810 RepID=UPI003F760BFA
MISSSSRLRHCTVFDILVSPTIAIIIIFRHRQCYSKLSYSNEIISLEKINQINYISNKDNYNHYSTRNKKTRTATTIASASATERNRIRGKSTLGLSKSKGKLNNPPTQTARMHHKRHHRGRDTLSVPS